MMGVAFDGDADRCLAVDEDGNMVNGDQIMGILAPVSYTHLDVYKRQTPCSTSPT